MISQDLPGGWLTLALFLIIQLATAIVAHVRLDGRVIALERRQEEAEDALKALGRLDGRLIKIEILLDQILHRDTQANRDHQTQGHNQGHNR